MISPNELGISAADYYGRMFQDLRKSSGKALVRCVFHSERTGSLNIDLDTGQFKCFGCDKAGDIVDFHMATHGLDFAAACLELGRGSYSLRKVSAAPAVPNQPDEKKQAKARQLWYEGESVQAGDVVDRYLRGRGIHLVNIPPCLRFHSGLDYWVQDQTDRWISKGKFPAMLARIDSPNGDLAGVHRTYLTSDGKKIVGMAARKIMGSIEGGAIRLCKAGDLLAVSEGIETGLAYHQLTGVPVWAGISTSGFARMALPADVKKVYICVDIDPNGNGEAAAKKLAKRILEQGRQALMARPPVSASGLKTDWNDYLQETQNK
jgi:putative DNA primase/helicase